MGSFDRIDHAALLQKLNTMPTFRRAIKAWLKAGVMDGPDLFPTEEGAPQGGVISPLLANIALHGLESFARVAPPSWTDKRGQPMVWTPTVVRYADDFVILHDNLQAVEEVQAGIAVWLSDMGLELKPSKTRIAHTLYEHEGETPGFDFLGFHVCQFPVGKTHAGKLPQRGKGPTKRIGFEAAIRPSKESMRRHDATLKKIIRSHRAVAQAGLIRHLNPVIRGWTKYFSAVPSYREFRKLDFQLYAKLRRWGLRRHSNKSGKWVAMKYWRLEHGTWTFGTKDGMALYDHVQTPYRPHAKVRLDASPFDGDWSYWATRLGKHPELPLRVAKLLKRQQGMCAWCGLYFRMEDQWEVDHIVPQGSPHRGPSTYANLQLLHQHCHDQKTARDRQAVGVHDTNQATEEPDDGKLSRPVLKSGGAG